MPQNSDRPVEATTIKSRGFRNLEKTRAWDFGLAAAPRVQPTPTLSSNTACKGHFLERRSTTQML